MSLYRKAVVFAFIVVSTLACHDPAAPIPPVGYRLSNVNGRPLPTFLSPIPESGTLVAATLELDATDGAILIERIREMTGVEVTRTSNYTYTITGNQIQFAYNPPCPPNALCVEPPHGTIAGFDLSLIMYGAGSGVVYNFRLVSLPD